MAFNINEFKGTMDRYGGPARANLYVVEIASAPNNTGMRVNDLRFFCQAATIPGLNYTVSDYFPNGFGVRQSIPTASSPDQFNCVFILDSDHAILTFFHQWMQSVINYNYASGAFSSVNDQLPFEVGYKKDFATKITIKHYSTDSDNYYQYDLWDAFPTQVSGIDVAWSNNDSYATVTVNFSYSHMSTTGSVPGNPTERGSRGNGLIDLINRTGDYSQVISQGSLPSTVQDAINLLTRSSRSINNLNTGITQIKNGINRIRNIV